MFPHVDFDWKISSVSYGTEVKDWRGRAISSGGHGLVSELGPNCVVKTPISPLSFTRFGIQETFLREAVFLKRFHGYPNIISSVYIELTNRRSKIVLPKLRGDISDLFFDGEAYADAFHTFREIVKGVSSIHMEGFIHSDLKPGNVLYSTSKGYEYFISDLDCRPEPILRECAVPTTFWYRAPEFFWGAPVMTKAIDIWALGCILWFLYNGSHLFEKTDTDDDMKKAIYERKFDVSKIPEGLRDIFLKMLSKDPNDRPTIQELAVSLGIVLPERIERPPREVTILPDKLLKARKILLAWIGDEIIPMLYMEKSMRDLMLSTTERILDRFLFTVRTLNLSILQAVGVTCFLIATKIICPVAMLAVSFLANLTDGAASVEMIEHLELFILKVLDLDVL